MFDKHTTKCFHPIGGGTIKRGQSERPVHSSNRTLTAFLRIAVYVTIGCIISPTVSQAQQQAQYGNALDANPMVGTGGSNTPIQGYEPINPNLYGSAAINGSVLVPRTTYQVVPVTIPGGGTTYARIPAVNQNSFSNLQQIPQGSLPLYTVNAVSNGSSINSYNNNINALNPGLNPQGMGYANSNNIGNGSVYGVGATSYVSPFGYFGANSPTIYGGSSLVTPLPGYPIYNGGESALIGQVSPLFGLRQTQVQQASLKNSLNGQFLSAQSGANTNNNSSNGTNSYSNPAQVNSLINGQYGNGQAQNNSIPQGIGQPIVGLVGAPKTNQPASGGDLYQQLLNELASGKKSAITAPGLPGKPALIQTTPNSQEQQNQNVLQIDPITGLPIASLTGQQAGTTPGGQNTGTPPNSSVNNNTNSNANNTSPTNNSGSAQPTGIKLSSGLSDELQVGQNVRTLNTLVGPTPGDFNNFMKSAQNNLKKGLFLYAIEDYQAAAMIDSNNMLPVVGQANAELGGGFYISAVSDLKALFTNHPELTAVRYNLSVMLPSNALASITADLEPMAVEKSDTAAFLLSYIYYQTDQKPKLESMLNTWAGWNNSDPWPAILHKAWLEKPASDSSSGVGANGANP